MSHLQEPEDQQVNVRIQLLSDLRYQLCRPCAILWFGTVYVKLSIPGRLPAQNNVSINVI